MVVGEAVVAVGVVGAAVANNRILWVGGEEAAVVAVGVETEEGPPNECATRSNTTRSH